MYLHVFKCDPTFTVIVVDIIRLHLRAKTGFCTQCCPILKNTLSYIFQINIGPFLLVCQVHLPETPSEPQTYLYSIDFSLHEYTLLSHPFAHPLIFSLRLSGGKITFTCYTCFNHPLMRSSLLIWLALSSVPKTYIVNRFLSLHQCSIIQDMRPCFRCKHTTRQMLQPDTQTALTAAATIFTVIDLNVRVCREVIICVSVICVLRWDDKP